MISTQFVHFHSGSAEFTRERVQQTGHMARKDELEERIEALEQQVAKLNRTVTELANLAPTDMDNTPMAVTDARTWKHPETAIHIYEAVDELVKDSPNYVVSKKEVKQIVADDLDISKEEVRATMKRLVDEDILKDHGMRVKISPEAQKIDPPVLFKSNLTHAGERREEAASRGKAVDNPDHKYET